jgi:hypothetical protein
MMTKFGRCAVAIAFLCSALSAHAVSGASITFAFKGTVDRVLVYEPLGNQNWPEPGTSFQGTYTFDSNAIDSSADPLSAVYTASPSSGVRVKVGQFELAALGTYVATYDVLTPAPRDLYEAGNWLSNMELHSHPELAAVLNRNHFQLQIDGNPLLLDGLALPLTPPPLAAAFQATMALSLDNGQNTRPFPYVLITAELDSLTLVPEPCSLVSFVVVVCVAWLGGRHVAQVMPCALREIHPSKNWISTSEGATECSSVTADPCSGRVHLGAHARFRFERTIEASDAG